MVAARRAHPRPIDFCTGHRSRQQAILTTFHQLGPLSGSVTLRDDTPSPRSPLSQAKAVLCNLPPCATPGIVPRRRIGRDVPVRARVPDSREPATCLMQRVIVMVDASGTRTKYMGRYWLEFAEFLRDVNGIWILSWM